MKKIKKTSILFFILILAILLTSCSKKYDKVEKRMDLYKNAIEKFNDLDSYTNRITFTLDLSDASRVLANDYRFSNVDEVNAVLDRSVNYKQKRAISEFQIDGFPVDIDGALYLDDSLIAGKLNPLVGEYVKFDKEEVEDVASLLYIYQTDPEEVVNALFSEVFDKKSDFSKLSKKYFKKIAINMLKKLDSDVEVLGNKQWDGELVKGKFTIIKAKLSMNKLLKTLYSPVLQVFENDELLREILEYADKNDIHVDFDYIEEHRKEIKDEILYQQEQLLEAFKPFSLDNSEISFGFDGSEQLRFIDLTLNVQYEENKDEWSSFDEDFSFTVNLKTEFDKLNKTDIKKPDMDDEDEDLKEKIVNYITNNWYYFNWYYFKFW